MRISLNCKLVSIIATLFIPPVRCLQFETLMDAELVSENLYEIPSCTICLQELSQDLSSLACGHVFHISCITQHFEYRGSCPNCQKRAQLRQVRLVVFPVTHNTKAGAHLRGLLAGISNSSEAKQIEGLLLEIKDLSQKGEKYLNDVKELEKENRKKVQEAENYRREYDAKAVEVAMCKKEMAALQTEYSRLKEEDEKNFRELLDVRGQLDNLLLQKKEFEQYKTWQKVANQNSEQLVKFKREMEHNLTAPEEMAKAFFELLQVKTLNFLKVKEKQKEAVDLIRHKDEEATRMKNQIKGLRAELEDFERDKTKLRKKCDDVRSKFRDFYEKTKGKTQEISEMPELEDSMSLSMGAKFCPKPVEKQPTFNLVDKSKNQPKISFGNMGLKKKAEVPQKPKTIIKNFML